MKYGLYLPQGWTTEFSGIQNPIEAYEAMTQIAREADTCGYESVWLVDHLHAVSQPTQEMLFESWTTIAALARDTKRVRIGHMVSSQGYRHPALLAKMASTVDVISHGRLTIGIGAGSSEREHHAYGYAYPPISLRLRQLAEAAQVLRAMWTDPEATFDGTFYQVHGAINQPKGIQQPHIPLLIGGSGEKVTLKLVALYADACNIDGGLSDLEHKLAILKRQCEQIGRDYQSIYRTVNVLCILADTDEEALANIPLQMKVELGSRLETMLIGSPDTIRERITAYKSIGVQELVIRFPDPLTLFELYNEQPSASRARSLPNPLQLDAIHYFARTFIT